MQKKCLGPYRIGIDFGKGFLKVVRHYTSGRIDVLKVVPVSSGKLIPALIHVFLTLKREGRKRVLVGATGSGEMVLADVLGVRPVTEAYAISRAIDRLEQGVTTVLGVGANTSSYYLYKREDSGQLVIKDSKLSGRCAGGSGEYIGQMVRRLKFPSRSRFIKAALKAKRAAALSSKCAVLAEADTVHQFQIGTPREDIAGGTYLALARGYKTLVKGKSLEGDRIAMIGGCAMDRALVHYLGEVLGIKDRLFVPDQAQAMGAIGAALAARSLLDIDTTIRRLTQYLNTEKEYDTCQALSLDNVEIMQPNDPGEVPLDLELVSIGVDIGSVSTKSVAFTIWRGQIYILAWDYRKTNGNPLKAVQATVAELNRQLAKKGYRIKRYVGGTTGSGRGLSGDLIGADSVEDEIQAQAEGVKFYFPEVDTIFEMGGQDTKYVKLDEEEEKKGEIVDFEMNKACAAGAGAFLEEMATLIDVPIEEFGQLALTATRPVLLDPNCTVFTRAEVMNHLRNGVSIADIAAGVVVACCKNYLNVNVGGRQVGKHVSYQGAVAFNLGMPAAMSMLINRGRSKNDLKKIVVPPNPHLTGAVGVAKMAFEACPEGEASFRGFDAIAAAKYEASTFECKDSCPHGCVVNKFVVDGSNHFYNDVCEKWSRTVSAQRAKRQGAAKLPDYFEQRTALLYDSCNEPVDPEAPEIGIPLVGMAWNNLPLYYGFLASLGFRPVFSKPSKSLVGLGVEASIEDVCIPSKESLGHALNLVEQGITTLFVPGIHSTEQPNPNMRQAQTCTWLHCLPEIFRQNPALRERGDVRIVSPHIDWKRGRKHLLRTFVEAGEQLGKTKQEAIRAFEAGERDLLVFRERELDLAEEAFESLDPEKLAIVVAGRPYTLWNPEVNMNAVKRIQAHGVQAIPQDFLPLEEADISGDWPNAYNRQIQRKLQLALLLATDERFKSLGMIVISHFQCGPDSFGNPFTRAQLLGKPAYVMYLDEHTAPAGVETRISAYIAAAKNDLGRVRMPEKIRSVSCRFEDLENRTLMISPLNGAEHILAAAFDAYGVRSEALPESPDPGLTLAREVIDEYVCGPMFYTTEDMLYHLKNSGVKPSEVAYFGSDAEGPCRFGMYSMLMRGILDKLGYKDVEIASFGIRNDKGKLGFDWAFTVWAGMVSFDLLQKMVSRSRPYETVAGASDAMLLAYRRELVSLVYEHSKILRSGMGFSRSLFSGWHLDGFKDMLTRAQMDFTKLIPEDTTPYPIVGRDGEFYVRLSERANMKTDRELEALHLEVRGAPAVEFLSYANYISLVLSGQRRRDAMSFGVWWKEVKEGGARWFRQRFAESIEHDLVEATLPFLTDCIGLRSRDLVERGSKQFDPMFGGEAICTAGSLDYLVDQGLHGAVNLIPFGCLPGEASRSAADAISEKNDGFPIETVAFNGFPDPNLATTYANFAWRVWERAISRGDVARPKELVA